MEENKKQTVEMTAEEAEAFKQFQEKQAKEKAAKKRKEDREAYAQLVDSEIESAIPELRSLSEQMLAVKRKVYENFAEVINIKANVLKLTKDTQRTHTFTHSNGKMRLTLGYNCIDDYRDTVNDGIAIVKQYIESLATDTKSKELVATILQLLSRDGTGNLKASRVCSFANWQTRATTTNSRKVCKSLKRLISHRSPSSSSELSGRTNTTSGTSSH